MHSGRALRDSFARFGACFRIAIFGATFVLALGPTSSQQIDCGALAARIAALGDGSQTSSNHSDGAAQKRRAELDRAIRSARALGCDRGQFSLFDAPPPQCPGLNARIQQMQANLAQYQGGGDSASNPAARQLIASYNARCRGQVQAAVQPRQRGFFESLFGIFGPNPNPFSFDQSPRFEQVLPLPGEDLTPRGGSQAVCVRDCDGGFFPLNLSARQSDPDQLTGLCQALCPNASVSVYTRSPNQDINTAVSLDGESPYSDLPNALKFEKSFDPACTCKPAGQSWAATLAGAEQILGRERKSDIVVTPEKSAELAKPKFEKAAPPRPGTQPSAAKGDQAGKNSATAEGQAGTQEVTGPDGVKRRVRIIVPPL
ncbi:MAG: DUF2865 domain-containing protein [Methylocella sp.]